MTHDEFRAIIDWLDALPEIPPRPHAVHHIQRLACESVYLTEAGFPEAADHYAEWAGEEIERLSAIYARLEEPITPHRKRETNHD